MWIHKLIQRLLSAPKFPGRDYLIEKLPKLFIKPATGEVVVATNFGFRIKLDPTFDKNIENVIYERGVYEQGTISVLQQFLNEGDTLIDVGANIGFLSLVGAVKVGRSGHVHSFEPFPSTYSILEENKAINDFEHLKLHQFALGNENETQIIYPENKNRGGASIINHVSERGISINVKKLDDFNFENPINVLKIDVEGYEFEVLKGAECTVRKDHPKLIIEHSLDRENTAINFELYNWVLSLGFYKIFRLKGGKERSSNLVEIANSSELPVHDNIFCIPIESII